MSSFIILIIILGTVFGILTVFIVKSFITPRKISALYDLLQKGRYVLVIRAAKKIVSKDPHSIDGHYLLGLGYLGDGKEELALMEFKKVNEIGAFTDFCREIPFRKEIAKLYKKFGQIEEALKEYLLLIKAEPENAENYYHAGELFEERGKGSKAIAYYMKAVELDKRFGDAHYRLGVLLYRHKKNLEAKAELEIAVKLQPENYSAYYYLGRLLKEDHDYAGALKMFEKAQRAQELKVKVLIERGTCYMSMNNFNRAISEFERALKFIADDGSNEMLYTRYFLAFCYEKMRNLDKAIMQWEKIYSKKPTFKDVAEKLAQYQELRTDDMLKDYLTASTEWFFKICTACVNVLKLKVQEIKEIPNGCQIMAVENQEKWRNAKRFPVLVRFYRVSEILDEGTVRSLHEEMKKANIMRGIIFTSSTFSRNAYNYAETRPIDLYNKNKLQELLKRADL